MTNNKVFNFEFLQLIHSDLVSQHNSSLLWVIDTSYRLLKCNKAAENYLFDNYSLAISVGESVLDLKFDAELLKKWESLYNSAFKGESFVINGSTFEKNKQSILEQLVTITPLKNLQNCIVGVYCSANDVNIKNNVFSNIIDEQKLISELNKYEEAILVFEQKNLNDYEIKYVNNQFLKLTRIENDVIGKNLLNYLKPEQLPLVKKKYENVLNLKVNEVWHEQLSIGDRTETVIVNVKAVFCNKSDLNYFVATISKLPEITDSSLVTNNLKHKIFKTFKFSEDIFCTSDKNGKIILVSEGCFKILGYRSDELVGKNYINFVFDPDKAISIETEKFVQSGNATKSFENRYVHKDGSIINLSWSAYWDDVENIMYTIARDVTNFNKIIAKATETEKLLNEAQRSAKMGSWNYDCKQNKLSWSESLYAIFDIEKTDFNTTYQSFLNFVTNDYKQFVDENIKNCALTGQPFEIIYKIVTVKGEQLTIDAFGFSEKDDSGAIIRIYGTAQVLTDRKKIENALEKSEYKYKYLFQNNPQPLFIFDFKTLQIVDCNIEALLLYGYTRKSFLKLTILDIRPAEDINLILDITTSEAKYGEINKQNWRHQKKNGEIFYVDVTGHLIEYENRRCSFVLINDVTDKIALEKKEKEHIHFIETTLENLPIGVAVSTIDEGTATLMNQKFLEIYGWPKEILIDDTTFFENVYPDKNYRESVVQQMVTGIQSKNQDKMLWEGLEIKTQSGEKRIINIKNIPLYSQNLMLSIVTDVTEKYNFEKSLDASNERYRYASKATSDAIWDWDLDTNLFYWGEGISTLFGYEYLFTKTHTAQTWFDLIHKDDYKIISKHLKEILKSDIVNWSCEHRVIKSDGSIAFVNQKAMIIRNVSGRAIRLIGAIQDISNTKKREQQLKLYESVVTNTTDGVIITEAEPVEGDLNGIIFVNEAFTKMTGYTLQDALGKNPRFLQGAKTDCDQIKKLRTAILRYEPCEITTINYNKDGSEFWSNFAVSPVANENGWFTHWVSIQRDVTNIKIEERKRSLINQINFIFKQASNLQEAINNFLKTISTDFGYPLVGLWLLDEEKDSLNLIDYHFKADSEIKIENFFKNDLVYCYTDKSSGLLGTAWQTGKIVQWSVNSSEHEPALKKEIIAAGIQKLTAIPILFNNTVNGAFLIGEVENKIRFDDKILISNEIASHLGAEIKRKQIEQELSKIFNFSPNVICVINKSGKFKRVNPAGCILFGFNEDVLLQLNIIDLAHPDDVGNLKKKLLLFQKKEQTVYFESRFITSYKTVKWMAWSASNTEEGFIYSIGKDITDRKDADSQLKLLNFNLLQQTKKLHVSNQELEQFAYVASHDLQEPLRMVTSFLTLIENKYNDKLDEKGRGYIKFAVEGAKNMRQIILSLLSFSLITDNETGYEDIDLSDIINEVNLLQSRLISDKKAIIIFDNLPAVYAPRQYMIQLFQNLISNALKYSNNNVQCIIKITSKNHKNYFVVSVADNGIGIEKEYFDKIFVIFQRLHQQDEYQGNGMGLAITKKIMEKLNGKIWVESKIGFGSTFNIMIPKNNKKT